MAQAKVVNVSEGIVDIKVRRNARIERLDRRHSDLRVGDTITIKRVTNNPYAVRVQ